MNTRPVLIESLETRRLMSATCGAVPAAEPSAPQPLLLPAVQKVREAAARISVSTNGASNTLTAGAAAGITDGTSNTILFAEVHA
jgi:hypothetical protein